MPCTPQDFVSSWKRVTALEKQIYQERFLDLTGTRFGFEMGAAKTSGANER